MYGKVLAAETFGTFWLVLSGRFPAAKVPGGLSISLGLTLIHLISIPVTNTSVNPARSTSQAVIANVFCNGVTRPMQQL